MKTKILLFTAIAIWGLQLTSRAQVPSYVPTNGLVSWWGFNGNSNDESTNGLNGIVTGAVLTEDRYSVPNSAYLFNSFLTEIDCSNDPLLDLNECTYSAWVQISTLAPGSYQTILAKWDSDTTCDFSLSLSGGTVHSFFVGTISPPQYVDLASTTSLQLNQWYHVVTTHSVATGLKVYINGVLDASDNTSFNVNALPVNDHFRIGSQGSFIYPMQNGKIDDVGVWDRELNQTEITALFNSSSSIGEIAKNALFNTAPNPFSVETTIHSTNFIYNASLTIYNSFGQKVKQMDNLSGKTIVFNRDNLADGIYYWQLTQENKTIGSDKLVVTQN